MIFDLIILFVIWILLILIITLLYRNTEYKKEIEKIKRDNDRLIIRIEELIIEINALQQDKAEEFEDWREDKNEM